MSILQYLAKKQVGSLPNPEGTLSNARIYEIPLFRKLAFTKSNYARGLNCRERYHTRELMSFHFIFVTNFIRDKNPLYGSLNSGQSAGAVLPCQSGKYNTHTCIAISTMQHTH